MRIACFVPVVGLASGCLFYTSYRDDRPAPHLRTLAEAKILELAVNLGELPGLCPGKQAQLQADATVQWPGAKPVHRTIGSDADSLAAASFSVTGSLVHGDEDAHLLPDPDVLKSVEVGFVADIAYSPQSRFKFHETFKPEYSCFVGLDVPGEQGAPGDDGASGSSGSKGANGTAGANGHGGKRGAKGGHIEAFVTEVSTPFYPKLLAVHANDSFFLAPADRPLVFAATGGAGGTGGSGGRGGAGGDQATYNVTEETHSGDHITKSHGQGAAGNGGDVGTGGDGGDGGDGGTVVVTYDEAFPELRELIHTNVAGGSAGAKGSGGSGGSKGTSHADKERQEGQPGQAGQDGDRGHGGGPGHADVRAGSVASKFGELPGVSLLGRSKSSDSPQPHHHKR